jgi:dTDP-4-dehydrorhamnose 3,5-epimerase
MAFLFTPTSIEGLVLVEPQLFADERGFFMECYKESEFLAAGISGPFFQDNHSLSRHGVLRGLHFQSAPKAQGKLVRVLRGKAWDVAVDMRANSHSFGKWLGFELSSENRLMLYLPPGFAHGFLCLSEVVELSYKCTAEYDKASDRGVRWNDPELGIEWPFRDVIVSEKDSSLPFLRELG